MNKYNKGFSPIAVILIIVAVLVVGAGAYFVGKNNKSNSLINQDQNTQATNTNTTQNNSNQNQPQQTACNANSPTTIRLISPNGGEVYQAGQQITVKWKGCNIDPNTIGVALVKRTGNTPYTQSQIEGDYSGFTLGGINPYVGLADDGSEVITLPPSSNTNLTPGQHYFLTIMGTGDATHVGSGYGPYDYSNGLFTINVVPHPPISTTLPQYIGTAFNSWPPIIQNSLTAFSCATGSTGGDTPTVASQRVIGTRTYCVSKGGDGYAGGYGFTYTYTTANGSGTKTTTFSLLYQSCGVYGGPTEPVVIQCHANQDNFNAGLDALIDSLM